MGKQQKKQISKIGSPRGQALLPAAIAAFEAAIGISSPKISKRVTKSKKIATKAISSKSATAPSKLKAKKPVSKILKKTEAKPVTGPTPIATSQFYGSVSAAPATTPTKTPPKSVRKAAPSSATAGPAKKSEEASESEANDDEETYVVEKVLDSRKKGDSYVYKVRWEGYGPEGDSWEPEENMLDAELLVEYWRAKAEGKL
eukprot:TRINITY_DN8551_c0_g1_i1.p1 TRINITY_DN8551_c0_g1~~TRINITY_DN8551_c0_g1_i1.p1  ORF type:complete len:201 (-),score=49.04 TRINITY_DN8551_c0_g1_i1:215-817(-)